MRVLLPLVALVAGCGAVIGFITANDAILFFSGAIVCMSIALVPAVFPDL